MGMKLYTRAATKTAVEFPKGYAAETYFLY